MYQMNTTTTAAEKKAIAKEEYLLHQSICRDLDETWEKMHLPGAKWLTKDEFWKKVKEATT